jgi:hypothetical protein
MKIDSSDVRTTDAGETKGCGCGEHARHGERPAAQPEAAGPVETSGRDAQEEQHAHEAERGSGCCGGSKAHK